MPIEYYHYRTNVILFQMTMQSATMHRRAQNAVQGHHIGNGTYTSKSFCCLIILSANKTW